MLNFTVDSRTCTRCGACVSVCPPRIVELPEENLPPRFTEEGAGRCISLA